MNKRKLILIRRCSSSGKSTFANFISDISNGNVLFFEADMWMTENGEYKFSPEKLGYCHNQCYEGAKKALQNGCDVVVSNTSTREQDVKKYQDLATECGADFISLIVERRHEGTNQHGVSDLTLRKQEEQLRGSIKLR